MHHFSSALTTVRCRPRAAFVMPQASPGNANPKQRRPPVANCFRDTPQRTGAGYTTGMRLSVFQERYLLLPILFLLSLVLHLLAIAWFDPRPAPRLAPSGPLAVTLAGASRATLSLPTVAPAPPQAIPPAPAPVRPRPRPPVPQAPAAAATATPERTVLPPHDTGPPEKPAQYRTASHDSVRIDYRVTGTDAADAHLAWQTDGSSYRLELGGVLGEFVSEGGLDDAGISPRRTSERLGAGQATTLFDRASGRIVDSVTGRSAQLVAGSQDDASVLLQLGAIGQADPDQLRSRLAFWIGGVQGARIVVFEMVGTEPIDTGIGLLETVRLARLAQDGQPLLEVWLAPQRAWLPVQLRVTGPDGAVRTQTVSAIGVAQTE